MRGKTARGANRRSPQKKIDPIIFSFLFTLSLVDVNQAMIMYMFGVGPLDPN